MQVMEKYCLFESGDIVGPFSARELTARAGFGAHSLICPVEHSEDGSYWKEAACYDEFTFSDEEEKKLITQADVAVGIADKALALAKEIMEMPAPKMPELSVPLSQEPSQEPAQTPAVAASDVSSPNPEMTLPVLPEQSLENLPAAAPDSAGKSAVQPEMRTITQENPIEEYFNTMRGGDLGNILGIPDKTNSDMDLIRAVEKQFEKTDPNVLKSGAQKDPFDEFADKKTSSVVDEADKQTQATLTQELLDLQTASSLPLKENSQPQADTSSLEQVASDNTVKTILEEGKIDVPETVTENTEKIRQLEVLDSLKMPAARISSAGTEEEKKMSQSSHVSSWQKVAVVCVTLMICLLGGGTAWYVWSHAQSTLPALQAPVPTVTTSVAVAAPVAVAANGVEEDVAETTLAEQAEDIVKHYVLDENRGSVEEYLAKRYANELASGYTAMWAAEPLHRNAYVVRYRLAKARKEPIVYVFQADTSKKQLTGALNNITLDLVGKINS